mgnify:CR=1 FL=1
MNPTLLSRVALAAAALGSVAFFRAPQFRHLRAAAYVACGATGVLVPREEVIALETFRAWAAAGDLAALFGR